MVKNALKEIRSVLYNHGKLIGMISDSQMPIKSVLLDDLIKINKIIEVELNNEKTI